MKKIFAALLLVTLTIGALGIAASANAMPFMNWKNFPNMQGNGNGNGNGHRQVQQSFVRWNGIITEWGTTNVTGAIQTQSRTIVQNSTNIRQGASATAMWTTNTSRPINGLRERENFTYAFYTAKLVSANVSGLNIGTDDFFLNGTWTVYNVTTTFTINTDVNGTIIGFHRSQDATAIVTNVYGELTVTGNWANFTLKITGVDLLTGVVHRQMTRSMMFNQFKVDDDDEINPNTVTSQDISRVAQAYGSMPGYGNYDQRMDFNFNYKIDIADLATAAANLNAN